MASHVRMLMETQQLRCHPDLYTPLCSSASKVRLLSFSGSSIPTFGAQSELHSYLGAPPRVLARLGFSLSPAVLYPPG